MNLSGSDDTESVHIAVTAAATTAVNTKKLAEICRPFIRQRSRVEKELKSLKEKLKGWRAEFCKDSKVKVEDVNALLENGRANPSFPVSMTISQAVGCIYEDCERLEKLLNVLTAKGSIADADTIITAAVAHDENSRLGANRQANNVSARPVVATLEKARADFVSLQNKGLKLCDEIETMAAALRSDVRHKLDPPDHVIAQILSETDNGIFRPEDEWQYMMHACLFMDEATKRLERVKAGMADFRHLTASITQRDEAMNLSDNDDNESDPNATATTTATIAINTQKLEEICTPFADKRRELIDELRSLREKANRWRAELRKDAAVAVNDTMGSFDPMQCWQAEVLDGPSTATSKDDDNNDAKNIASSSKSAEPSITVEDDCRHLERLLDELEGFAPHPHQQSDWTSLTGLEDVLARFVSLQKEGLERCDAMETTVAALRANVLEPIDNPTEEQIAKMVIDAKQGNFLPEDQWPDVMRACLVMDKAAKRLGRVEAGLANVQAKLER